MSSEQATYQTEVAGQQLKTTHRDENKIEYLRKTKGSQCSASGADYEKKIHQVVKNSCIDDNPFTPSHI